MLEFLGYVAARVIAGILTALILAAIFNAQCNMLEAFERREPFPMEFFWDVFESLVDDRHAIRTGAIII